MNNSYLGYNMGDIAGVAKEAAAPKAVDERIVLPKDVAEAIDFYKEHYTEDMRFNLEEIARRARKHGNMKARTIVAFVNENPMNRVAYLKALVKGYRFEETPKQRAEAAYKRAQVEYVGARVGSAQEAEAKAVKVTIEKMNQYFGLGLNLDN